MTELDQLSRLCEHLGAEGAQARVMAAQLLKRAEQLVLERQMNRTQALAYLIDLVVKGRAGESSSESATHSGE